MPATNDSFGKLIPVGYAFKTDEFPSYDVAASNGHGLVNEDSTLHGISCPLTDGCRRACCIQAHSFSDLVIISARFWIPSTCLRCSSIDTPFGLGISNVIVYQW